MSLFSGGYLYEWGHNNAMELAEFAGGPKYKPPSGALKQFLDKVPKKLIRVVPESYTYPEFFGFRFKDGEFHLLVGANQVDRTIKVCFLSIFYFKQFF